MRYSIYSQSLLALALALAAVCCPAQKGEVPRNVRGFSGQVTGIVTARHDDGSFSYKVSRITRVWKDNKANNIEWFYGRTLRVGPGWHNGDDGRWRRQELHVQFIRRLVVKEDYRLEITHAERDRFAILELDEAQRALARKDYVQHLRDRIEARRKSTPRTQQGRLPPGLRGFSGHVGGIVRRKSDDGTFVFEVRKVFAVWKNSKAKTPQAIVGRQVKVAPRWEKGEDGKWRPAPVHRAFIRKLERGEDYRVEIQNHELDHFNILELSTQQRAWAKRRRALKR